METDRPLLTYCGRTNSERNFKQISIEIENSPSQILIEEIYSQFVLRLRTSPERERSGKTYLHTIDTENSVVSFTFFFLFVCFCCLLLLFGVDNISSLLRVLMKF